MSDPAAHMTDRPVAKHHVPNKLGNPTLHLAPRCGARTRAGGPCQAPAVHGRLRCRMHGGRSTGPRTAEGLARVRAARTTHGRCTAAQRAWDRNVLMLLRRTRLLVEVARWIDHLPPDLAARAMAAPELLAPPYPTRGITPREDRAMRRLERAAHAPWWAAVKAARAAWRERRAEARGKPARAGAEPGAPVAPRRADEASRLDCKEVHAPVGGRVAGKVARQDCGIMAQTPNAPD